MTLATVDGAFDRDEIDSLSPDATRTVLVSIDRDDVRSMD
jgi:hypothetical protein